MVQLSFYLNIISNALWDEQRRVLEQNCCRKMKLMHSLPMLLSISNANTSLLLCVGVNTLSSLAR